MLHVNRQKASTFVEMAGNVAIPQHFIISEILLVGKVTDTIASASLVIYTDKP